MIKLEYDVNTAGVRVSFVFHDGHKSLESPNDSFKCLGRIEDGKKIIPQTVETLDVVMQMLKMAQERKMEEQV